MLKPILSTSLAFSFALLVSACASTPDDEMAPVSDGAGSSAQAESLTGTDTPRTGEDDLFDFDYARPDAASEDMAAAARLDAADMDAEMEVPEKVHFAFDSASLSREAQMKLREVARFVKNNAGSSASLIIEGHADERGTREYNLALGDRRAVAVKKYLVGLGVDAGMLTTISYGKERPLVAAHTPEAWAKNRRAMIVIQD